MWAWAILTQGKCVATRVYSGTGYIRRLQTVGETVYPCTKPQFNGSLALTPPPRSPQVDAFQLHYVWLGMSRYLQGPAGKI